MSYAASIVIALIVLIVIVFYAISYRILNKGIGG